MTSPLPSAVVVITGASSGIGAATALALARRGTRLVLAARASTALADITERCRKLGAPAIGVPTDVADPAAVAALRARAEAEYGRIDAWVSNAAVTHYGRLLTLPLPELRRVVDVNVYGCLHSARVAVPALRAAGGGVLVVVASLLGEVSVPYMGPYNIAKHGVLGLCETLRQELRAEGVDEVSVCTVLPASVDTPLFGHTGNRMGRSPRPVPPANSVSRVAGRIVRALEAPQRRVYAGVGGRSLSLLWRASPVVGEVLLGRYGRLQFLARPPAPPTTGNLFAAHEGPVAVAGGWRRRRRRRSLVFVAGAVACAVVYRRYRKVRS